MNALDSVTEGSKWENIDDLTEEFIIGWQGKRSRRNGQRVMKMQVNICFEKKRVLDFSSTPSQ